MDVSVSHSVVVTSNRADVQYCRRLQSTHLHRAAGVHVLLVQPVPLLASLELRGTGNQIGCVSQTYRSRRMPARANPMGAHARGHRHAPPYPIGAHTPSTINTSKDLGCVADTDLTLLLWLFHTSLNILIVIIIIIISITII